MEKSGYKIFSLIHLLNMTNLETNCIVYLQKSNYSVYSLDRMRFLANRLGVLHNQSTTLIDLTKSFMAQRLASVDSAIEAVEPNAPNYWHFMAYVLPTILEHAKNANYILISTKTGYIKQYLSLLGISVNRLLPIRGRPIIAERLLLSGSSPPCFDDSYIPYSGLLTIADKLKSYRYDRRRHARIFIDRSSSNNGSINRRVLPDSSWKEFIVGLGFVVVYLENMTVLEQVQLFSEADVVMAMHGAALTNCIYMHREAAVIELMHENGLWSPYLNMFRTIGDIMGLNFHRVSCQPYLTREDEIRLQLASGNPSTNPLPVKHTPALEARIINILQSIH